MVQTIDLIRKNDKRLSAADKLIEAAGPLFADRPFDAVSTRELAKAANVNLSAISYHFGNKEGLYEAVFKKIIEDLQPVRSGFRSFMEAGANAAKKNPDLQREIIRTFVSAFIEKVISSENPRWRMRLMIREVHQAGPCFDMVMKGHIDIMHDLLGNLVALILGKPSRDPKVVLVSHSILGLCLQYALNQALISHRLEWDGYGEKEVAILKQETVAMAFAMLGLTPKQSTEG